MSDQIPGDIFDEDAAPVLRTSGTEFIDEAVQDDYDENAPLPFTAGHSVGYLDRSPDAAIAWGRKQITNPTQSWALKCQSFVRQCYGIPAWAYSAQAAWDKIPSTQKVKGGKPSQAPRAAALYFHGGNFGHVMLAIGYGGENALSNDYDERGKIDVVPRTIPNWNLPYLGWSAWTPFGKMRVVMPTWDGVVPDATNVRASRQTDKATTATYRVACRLYDLGYYEGKPLPEGKQKYPANAIVKFQKSFGGKGSGNYGRKTHSLLFDL